MPRSTSLALAGVALAVVTGVVGLGVQQWRFGWSEARAFIVVERDVRHRIDVMTADLRDRAVEIAERPEQIEQARIDMRARRQLFDRLGAPAAEGLDTGISVTVYSVGGTALAWAGRPTELPSTRLVGPDAVFTAPGPAGLQLVYVHGVFMDSTDDTGAGPTRVATVATETPLSSPSLERRDIGDRYILDTPIAPVTLRPRFEGAGDRPAPGAFLITSSQAEPLLEVQVSQSDLRAARTRARRRLASLVLLLLALTLATMVPAQLARRHGAPTWRADLARRLRIAGFILATAAVVWLADPGRWWLEASTTASPYTAAGVRPIVRSPLDLLVIACTLAALVALGLEGLFRLRVARRTHRRSSMADLAVFLAHQTLAGALLATLLVGFSAWLRVATAGTTVDLTHFSLHPWDSQRLAFLLGLIVAHAAVLWTGVAACLAAGLNWRIGGLLSGSWTTAVAARMAPVLLVWGAARVWRWDMSAAGVLLAGAACVLGIAIVRPLRAWYRHSSQASRLLASLLALLGPALLLYPSAVHLADRSKRDLVEDRFAPETVLHPDRLRQNLDLAMSQIDAVPGLQDLVSSSQAAATAEPATENAFQLWRSTNLASARLTSAVQLYDRDGRLVSRFSMNLSEDSRPRDLHATAGCAWTAFPEGAPFGAAERRLFHAERAICDDTGSVVGAVGVDVMLDYDTLPFISSQNPYFELFRVRSPHVPESSPERDIALVIYGWSGTPTYASGPISWLLDQGLLSRLTGSREPFWTTLRRRGTEYAVYFTNDRAGIYALGYPLDDTLERIVQLVELGTLAALAYALFLIAASMLDELARPQASSGRALFREIRESFYRRLFLAFVATSVVPLLILAVVMRGYFANRLRVDVEAEAGRTAAVVRRVIEESLAAQQRDLESPSAVTDATMVSIGNIIEQDVNIFAGARLEATSERDLFASGLLSTRTPDQVYRAIALQRQPQFVGEDELGGILYMLAAAPVRLGERDAILTVPLTLRQQEIEREIDELDRRVYLGAILFSLLGAALGFSMAERIADPVSRLTRATRRIARGDFDAAVATRSADELERLVDAFNGMAADLKRQRTRLERTNRLEAWAQMARQVAHEIKNPLTPIQLSAEHLRRVHADTGAPLGRVFDDCVDSILKQVHLLRHIAAEFSSFASAPRAHPSQVAVAGLIREVVDPYRPGIEPRVTITTDIAEPMPPAYIDRTLVARALTNLIENALHAMSDGGHLSIAAATTGDAIEISVTDTGGGMGADALARVFEPYFSTKTTGTGLGLTIAKRNVELTRGSIRISSQPGRGTTATLTLPMRRATSSDVARLPPPGH